MELATSGEYVRGSDAHGEIVEQLIKQMPTEQDIYWFVVEAYDRIMERGNALPTVKSHFPLLEIEYDGRRSESSYVGKHNPGVVFLDEKVSPPLTAKFGEVTSNQIRSGVYGAFRQLASERVNQLRVKYAVHYHNNCMKNGDYHHAELWGEVIELLEN